MKMIKNPMGDYVSYAFDLYAPCGHLIPLIHNSREMRPGEVVLGYYQIRICPPEEGAICPSCAGTEAAWLLPDLLNHLRYFRDARLLAMFEDQNENDMFDVWWNDLVAMQAWNLDISH